MKWINILFLIQFFTSVFLEDKPAVEPGTGMELAIDNNLKILMELSYRRCTVMAYSKFAGLLNFSEVMTGEKLDTLRKYLIDLNNFEPEVNFKNAVLECQFIVDDPNSFQKEACLKNEAARFLCTHCTQRLSCYNRIMVKFFAKGQVNFTTETYNDTELSVSSANQTKLQSWEPLN